MPRWRWVDDTRVTIGRHVAVRRPNPGLIRPRAPDAAETARSSRAARPAPYLCPISSRIATTARQNSSAFCSRLICSIRKLTSVGCP